MFQYSYGCDFWLAKNTGRLELTVSQPAAGALKVPSLLGGGGLGTCSPEIFFWKRCECTFSYVFEADSGIHFDNIF